MTNSSLITSSETFPDGEKTAQPRRSLTGQVARGSLWSVGGQGVVLAVSLLTTPLVIRLLGTEAYGVWALINLLVGYLGFSDLGMTAASTRFASEAHAEGDDAGEARAVWTALLIGTLPALAAATALMLAAGMLLDRALRLPAYLQGEATLALRIAAWGFVARALAGVLNTPQLVRLKMRLNVTITTTSSVAQSSLVPAVLFAGGGLVGAAIIFTMIGFATALGHAICSQRLLPELHVPRLDRVLLRRMMRFGGAMAVSSVAFLLLVNSERLFLTRFASVKALAYYSVAQSLAAMLVIMPHAVGQSLLPAFTRLRAGNDAAGLRTLYGRAERAVLLFTPPLALLTAVAAPPFITLWAGAEFGRESVRPLYVLLISFVFTAACYVPFNVVLAAGRSDLVARTYWTELLPYLPVAALLTYGYGAVGAAAAWTLRGLADVLLFARHANRLTETRGPFSRKDWGRFAVLLVLLVGPVTAASRLTESWALPAVVAAATTVGYLRLVWLWLIGAEERIWVKNELWRLTGVGAAEIEPSALNGH